MDNEDLILAWYAATHTKRGPVGKKDKAMLKGLGVILGIVVFIALLFLGLMYSSFK